jgi:hypothetical protein
MISRIKYKLIIAIESILEGCTLEDDNPNSYSYKIINKVLDNISEYCWIKNLFFIYEKYKINHHQTYVLEIFGIGEKDPEEEDD